MKNESIPRQLTLFWISRGVNRTYQRSSSSGLWKNYLFNLDLFFGTDWSSDQEVEKISPEIFEHGAHFEKPTGLQTRRSRRTRQRSSSSGLWKNYLFDLGVFFGSEPILKNRFLGNRIFWRITGCFFGNIGFLSVFFGYRGHFRPQKELNWCLLIR